MIIMSLIELDELPKDCSYCPLCYDDMYCTAVKLPKGKGIRYDGKRPDWCPMMDITRPVMIYMGNLAKLFAEKIIELKEYENKCETYNTK